MHTIFDSLIPVVRFASDGDDRATSELLGVVLAFVLVVSVLAVVQVSAVPVWTADTEAAHAGSLQSNVVELDEAVLRAGMTGVEGRTRLDLAPTYPARFAFVTPPPAAGRLETTVPATVRIDNARALGAAAAYWDGSEQTYETRSVVARGSYHRFAPEPVHVVESGTVYTRDTSGGETVFHHAVVTGNRITLVAVDGDLDVSSTRDEVVTVSAVSVGSDPIRVESADGGPIVLRLPTALSEAAWAAELAEEPYATLADYDDTGSTPYAVVELDPAVSYDLRLAKVGVGSGFTEEEPAYLVVLDGDGAAVPEDGTQRVTVAVRDRFNNPVAGAVVRAETGGTDGTVHAVDASPSDPHVATTDSSGRATFVYEAPDDVTAPRPDSFDVAVDGLGSAPGRVGIELELRDATTTASVGPLGVLLFGALLGRVRALCLSRTVGRSRPAHRSRRPHGDRRATSSMLALLFAFGMVVSLVALVQVSAVPSWNGAVEADHSGDVDSGLAALDDSISRAADTGSNTGASVAGAPTYPDRPLLSNPAPRAGSMETTAALPVTVTNLTVSGPHAKFWTGAPHTFDTQSVVFEPSYTQLDDAATYREGGVMFSHHDNDAQLVDHQLLVDGTRLTIVLIEGDVDTARTGLSDVSVTALSVADEPVDAVASGGPITIRLPTHLDAEGWHDVLADQPHATVTNYETVGDHGFVTVTLDPSRTYQLSVARVGVESSAGPTPPAYVVTTDGGDETVPEGGSQRVVLTVSDEYGNPVAGVRPTVGAPTEGTVTVVGDGATDERGRFVLSYAAPDDVEGTRDVSFDVSVPGLSPPLGTETVTLRVVDDDPDVDFEVDVDDTTVTANEPYTGTVQILATEDSARTGDEIEYTVINARVVVDDGVRDVRSPWPDGDDTNAPGDVIDENINDPRYDQRAPDVPWVYTTETLAPGTTLTLELTAYETGDREPVGSTLDIGSNSYDETRATSFTRMRTDINTSDPTEENLYLLRDGDLVPNAGVSGSHQWSVREVLGDRIDATNRLVLADNEVVVLFELTGEATHDQLTADGGNPDYNDAVALLTLVPDETATESETEAGTTDDEGTDEDTTPPVVDPPVPAVTVDVPNVCSLADDPGVAFVDSDGDRAYDAGTDTPLSPSQVDDLRAGDLAVDGTLVVPESFGTIAAERIDLTADGLVLAVDVTATRKSLSVSAGDGGLCVDGATVETRTDGKKLDLDTTGAMSLTGATVVAQGPISITADALAVDGARIESLKPGKPVVLTATGDLSANAATVRAPGPVTLTGETVVADGALVESLQDSKPVTLSGGVGGLRAVGAEFVTDAPVDLTADGDVDLRSVSVVTPKESADVTVVSRTGDVALQGAFMGTVGGISVDAAGDVTLEHATLTTDKQQDIAVDAGGSLLADHARLSTDGHVELGAGGPVALVDASVVTHTDNKHVHVTAAGDVDLRSALLSAGGDDPSPSAAVVVTVGSGDTVFVDGATIHDRDDSLTVSPAGVTVV